MAFFCSQLLHFQTISKGHLPGLCKEAATPAHSQLVADLSLPQQQREKGLVYCVYVCQCYVAFTQSMRLIREACALTF